MNFILKSSVCRRVQVETVWVEGGGQGVTVIIYGPRIAVSIRNAALLREIR